MTLLNLADAGLEQIWTCIDYHVKFRGTFTVHWSFRPDVTQLKSALLDLYGKRCDRLGRRLTLSNEYTLGQIAKSIVVGVTLVSFNYDTLVENLVFKRKKELQLRHCPGAPADGVVRVVKPHGSASWDLNDLKREVTDGPPILESLAGVVDSEPLVLGAVPLKSELIAEVQCYHRSYRVFDVILRHWRGVADAIRDADRLVVLGYSFPGEDTYARFFFREAMRERKQPSLDVEYYELPNMAAKTRCAIMEAFGDSARPKYKGPVTPAPR